MKVDVEKWVFAGALSNKQLFFERAQQLGIIEFTSKEASKLHFQHASVNQTLEALKILSHLPEPVNNTQASILSPEKAAVRVVELKKAYEISLLKVKELENEKIRMAPWGSFSKETLALIEKNLGHRVSLVIFSAHLESQHPRLMMLYQQEGVGYGLWVSPHVLPEDIKAFHWEKDVGEITRELQAVQNLRSDIEKEFSTLKPLERDIEKLLFENLENLHLEWSLDCTGQALDNRLFYVEGWVPSDKEKSLEVLLKETQVWAHKVQPEINEVAPTYLKNGSLGKIGEDLVAIYDVPASTDKDPSLWVLAFFALFFSIIIGDAGYGAIFLAISLFFHFKYPELKGFALRVKRLAFLLSVSCIFWGFFTCAYFGLPFKPSHSLKKASFLHQLSLKKVAYHAHLKDSVYSDWAKSMPQIKEISFEDPQKIVEAGFIGSKESPKYNLLSDVNDALLKEFALFIGALHLILSLARYAMRTWSSWGWMLFIVAGWLYFPAVVKATTFVHYLIGIDPSISTGVGLQLLYLSLVLAFGLSILQNKIYGLLEIMNLIQVFSDVLSYLRLYALGLAGGIMSATFNDLAASAGLIPGIVIIGAGHLINLALGVMGGVVHGLRLNFLEWYHYSFSGAGRWFRPLKKIDESSR